VNKPEHEYIEKISGEALNNSLFEGFSQFFTSKIVLYSWLDDLVYLNCPDFHVFFICLDMLFYASNTHKPLYLVSCL